MITGPNKHITKQKHKFDDEKTKIPEAKTKRNRKE